MVLEVGGLVGGMTAKLTPPPSANSLRANHTSSKGGRLQIRQHKTPEYTAWLTHAIYELRQHMTPVGKENYPVTVNIYVFGGKGLTRKRDLDNFIKPIIDALVKSTTLIDDNLLHVSKVSATYVDDKEGDASCLVEVCW